MYIYSLSFTIFNITCSLKMMHACHDIELIIYIDNTFHKQIFKTFVFDCHGGQSKICSSEISKRLIASILNLLTICYWGYGLKCTFSSFGHRRWCSNCKTFTAQFWGAHFLLNIYCFFRC